MKNVESDWIDHELPKVLSTGKYIICFSVGDLQGAIVHKCSKYDKVWWEVYGGPGRAKSQKSASGENYTYDLKEKEHENDVIKILNIKLFQLYEKLVFINLKCTENLCRFFNLIR